MPDFFMMSRLTISRRRERYMRRGSIDCGMIDCCWDCDFASVCDVFRSASKASIPASTALVTSGRAGAPSGLENLLPLYSGGLGEAVKLMAPSALDWITA